MPNHLHVLIGFSNSCKNINRINGNGKRFMVFDVVDILKKQNHGIIIKQLAQAVNDSDRKRGKLHKLFKPSFDVKEWFILNKIANKYPAPDVEKNLK